MPQKKKVFLTAEWRDLVMLNYDVDPGLLNDYVPRGTVLDFFEGRTYVSLVGFRFLRTRLFGFAPVPFHADFDEVNLRFYVRCKEAGEDRRGVAFIAEIVPKRVVAQIARLAYGENYVCLPMKHCIRSNGTCKAVEYEYAFNDGWCKLHAHTALPPAPAEPGSLEQFITEHYWGYSKQGNRCSLEYRVSHSPWNVWSSESAGFQGDASGLYGVALAKVLQRRPDSAFIADGSPVTVFTGQRIQ